MSCISGSLNDKEKMAQETSEKLLFRMQHIIPQNLNASSEFITVDTVIVPEEVEFPMTWGKVAGIDFNLLICSFC